MTEPKASFKINDKIQWKWLGRIIEGTVKEVYFQSVSKTIKGKAIKRNGSKENPAYLVEAISGNVALKLHTELQLVEKKKFSGIKPRLFSGK